MYFSVPSVTLWLDLLEKASDPETKVRHREGVSPGPTPSKSYAFGPTAAHGDRIEAIVRGRSGGDFCRMGRRDGGGNLALWLFKEEPAEYRYADLERDGSA